MTALFKLFKLEKSRDKGDILSIVEKLIEWLGEPGQAELRRAFTVWMNRVMTPPDEPWDLEFESPKEAREMLSKTMEKWRREAREEGLREGREEGREEGVKSGLSLVVVRLVEDRFGDLPPGVVEKIRGSDSASLMEMARRVLAAQSIDQVLGG